ncbi:PAS-domain containing protein [Primorskyibacter sp. 2E233]|uniref:PAS-domain containing protein n=1 Tax=Primorskyibacter sp. 2E233 TaxID=3413431 RepID=UPI003BF205F2
MTWNNSAFDLLKDMARDSVSETALTDLGVPEDLSVKSVRTRIEKLDGTTRWFEVTSRKTTDGWMHFATDIDTLIEAELAQRNFVQTLAKTFAHLPIGLAVFDRDRRLVLFNPALVDLTRLPVDFLSARPNLLSFFDHMRENRMMPEPKNYATWREQLTDVITAARDDRYCETWSLASGLTYKITGRPHPDGAVAFLLEDISAEISLTRRFRSELELTQSVIDCFHDAVAVFSRLGVLTFSNSAYRELWNCDPDSAFSEMSIVDATNDWQAVCEPSPIWTEMRDYVLTMQDRTAWDAPLQLEDGRNLHCWVEPVSAGATMVRFSFHAKTAEQRPLKESAAIAG